MAAAGTLPVESGFSIICRLLNHLELSTVTGEESTGAGFWPGTKSVRRVERSISVFIVRLH